MRLISQLISDISRVLQKILKNFNGNSISTYRVPVFLALFKKLDLNLNELEFVMLLSNSSLQYLHKRPHVFA